MAERAAVLRALRPGAAGAARHSELLDGIVDAWVEPAAQILAAHGFAEPHAIARLGIAVTRGLLLDLLATGDRAAVDAAMEVHIASLMTLIPAG